MKPKKNPNVDLNRNSGLYFVIGLTLVLFLTWRALELKTYDKEIVVENVLDAEDVTIEEVPITQTIKTPPPPPPVAAPQVIEIVEDLEDIEETVIESTEADQDAVVSDVVVDVDDVEVGESFEEISVPFSIIEDVPIFPGCEKGDNEAKRACFKKKIQEHIAKNFEYPGMAKELGIQGRVFVLFTINSQGHVSGVKSRGPDKLLTKEAERIIGLLPKMKPGKQRGRPVKVPYSIPITFKLKKGRI
ncbi:energy transducer TonB [Sediminicola luteus]|uniref:Energy transducer TonB n=1 Tax=Sediminicola luteus TaxID=319238 RepID=A0A2A4G5B5_9FLAO|nr:energy transducer TonB [Sediminicola luteus]PCE63154.1 energy transducer TonB [Sediminicola luteus]